MPTSFDLSQVTALRSLGLVARVIDDATSGITGRWLIVGATARDLILTFVHQLPEGRATVDLDIAVTIESWQTFAVLEKQLLDLGGQRDPSMAHRFRLRGWRIDIVPFGGVERDGVISWPPDHDIEMTVMGFEEVSLHAFQVSLPGGVRVFVASPPGLLLLKLIAWEERHRELPRHDAIDIRALIDSYDAPWNQDRLYDEADDLLQRFGYDNALAAAALLGRDAAAIARPATFAHIRGLLEREVLTATLLLASEMGGRPEENLSLLESVLAGFEDAALSQR